MRSDQPFILVLEDDASLAALLRYNLGREGFRVELCADGAQGLTRIAETAPDLVILDWMLPSLEGIEVCRRLRQNPATRSLPIIMFTARREDDPVRGLDAGADDFIIKPFLMSELAARVRAVLRRIRRGQAPERTRHGDIVVDRSAHRVSRGGHYVHLGPTEFRLLDYFMQHPGRVISREQILAAVWGSNAQIQADTIDVHVGRLRRALIAHGGPSPIRTVRMEGYALDANDGHPVR